MSGNTYLLWLLLIPLVFSILAFVARWFGRLTRAVVILAHLISVTAVLVLSLLTIQFVLVSGQVFGLGKRAEDRLEQGYVRAQAGPDLTETAYLSGEMRCLIRIEYGQVFPILWLLDRVVGVAARPFGGTFPGIFCTPILDSK